MKNTSIGIHLACMRDKSAINPRCCCCLIRAHSPFKGVAATYNIFLQEESQDGDATSAFCAQTHPCKGVRA
jgi:hypothetical protein